MGNPCDKTLKDEGSIKSGGAGEYWGRTDGIIAENGGCGPQCSSCGQAKTALDDHGRFACTNEKCSSNAGKSFIEMFTGEIW